MNSPPDIHCRYRQVSSNLTPGRRCRGVGICAIGHSPGAPSRARAARNLADCAPDSYPARFQNAERVSVAHQDEQLWDRPVAHDDAAPPARARGRLFVIAAPSGAGKTSLVKAFVEREPELQFSVSYTTRKPRPNEREGEDYHFVSTQAFQSMVANNEFLEHARVFDNHYGTSMNTVQQALADGSATAARDRLAGCAAGARPSSRRRTASSFLPPSLNSLEQRLRQRSTDSEDVIRRRLQDSVLDLAHWPEFEFVVVNDKFESALDDLQEIVRSGGSRARRRETAANRAACGRTAGLSATSRVPTPRQTRAAGALGRLRRRARRS